MKTMTEAEYKKLDDCLFDADFYLEYGTGDSTKMAAEKVWTGDLRYITTVESDRDFWYWLVLQDVAVKEIVRVGSLDIVFPYAGAPGPWGYPTSEKVRHLWSNYPLAVFNEVNARCSDLVLVDGRFRVACILACLLTLASDTVILVHDYRGRDHYHVVEPFVEIVDTVDTMVELRALEGFDREAASALLKEALYDPR